MYGAPKVRSVNVADNERETKPSVRQNGNKLTRFLGSGKHMSKLVNSVRKIDRLLAEGESEEERKASYPSHSPTVVKNMPSAISNQERLLRSNYSMNASCSSDASSDSFYSRASTGRITRSSSSAGSRRRPCSLKRSFSGFADVSVSLSDDVSTTIKRCAWVTPNTDPAYAAFHDEEWGVPQHDDKKLFELLVLCGALAELTWPIILSKRHLFREVFLDFDPIAVSKLNEKKLVAHGSIANSLLSELKLRSVVQNAIQITKVIGEFGSFDKYIWSFVNSKPIINTFRYPRQVPVKTPKADVISKDLVRRGFRSVGPTVIYSFMQVTGITNDHLISCYRFNDSIAAAESIQRNDIQEKTNSMLELEPERDISKAIDEMSLSSE